MKKLLFVFISAALLQACTGQGGESGTVNDGFSGVGDDNGGLPDTITNPNPSIDTSIKGEQRVDTERRDSVNF